LMHDTGTSYLARSQILMGSTSASHHGEERGEEGEEKVEHRGG